MTASKRPRRDGRSKAREQKRGRLRSFSVTFDKFAGRDSNLNNFKTHFE